MRSNGGGSYAAGDELVDTILKAGANVDASISSGTHAMFLAVKCADTIAIDSLIEAGIDLQQLDKFGRTCVHNALEHPGPVIIEKLLPEGLDLHEAFPTSMVQSADE